MQVSITHVALSLAGWLVLCVAVAAQAPGSSISSGYSLTNSTPAQANFFDVLNGNATNPVSISAITQFAGNANPTGGIVTLTFGIYTKPGTWLGFENTAGAWTLVATVSSTLNSSIGSLQPYLPLPSPVTIPAQASQAFCVHALAGMVPYVAGNVLGAPIVSDAYLQILEGGATPVTVAPAAPAAPFAAALSAGTLGATARWQGHLWYGPPSGPVWQVNQPGAAFDIDGVAGTATAHAVVSRAVDNVCTFSAATAHIQSVNVGLPWDLGLTPQHAHPSNGGGFVTAGGQKVNLLIAGPGFAFLNGGAFNVPMPAAAVALPAILPVPFSAGGQAIVIDPAQVDGFSLSGPGDLDFVPTPSPPAPPTAYGTAATYDFHSVCGNCAFPFFGTFFTEFSVSSSGRVTFGGEGALASPSVAAAMSGPGTAGAWTALFQATLPAVTGGVAVTSSAPGVVRVYWTSLHYVSSVSGMATFTLDLDSNNGDITIAGLNTITPFVPALSAPPAAGQMFFGISQGAGATDPGFVNAGLGFFPAPPLPTDMFYRFGVAGTLAPGLTRIVFSPSLTVGGNYDLTGY